MGVGEKGFGLGVYMVHIYNQRPQIAFRTAVYKAIAKDG